MLSCETPRMQRRSGSCKGLRMTPRSHRLRENSGYLDWCCVWSDSLSYDIWWWSDEENQTSLKKGLCGVLTFWAHLGHFFFFFAPLIHQWWKTSSLAEESLGGISQWAACSDQWDTREGKRRNCCQKEDDWSWDHAVFFSSRRLLKSSVWLLSNRETVSPHSWAIYSSGCTRNEGLQSPPVFKSIKNYCTRKNRKLCQVYF